MINRAFYTWIKK